MYYRMMTNYRDYLQLSALKVYPNSSSNKTSGAILFALLCMLPTALRGHDVPACCPTLRKCIAIILQDFTDPEVGHFHSPIIIDEKIVRLR